MNIGDYIDLERYPLSDITSDAYRNLVEACRHQFNRNGCCLLPGFLKPVALDLAKREAMDCVQKSHQMHHYFSYDDVNDSTLTRDVESLPEDHPRRFRSLTKIRFVARDLIEPDNPVKQIHVWPQMAAFLKDVMDIPQVYLNDCPLSGCVFTVAKSTELQDWHFDGNDFIVTLMLENSEEGGDFEFVTGLRRPGREDNFDDISSVLKGQYPDINRPDLKPGTLTLFKGKFNLHRVTAVKGDGMRVMAILSYETAPGRTGSDEYLKLFYNRTLSEAVRPAGGDG